MKKDKALYKVLENVPDDLPYGFEQRVMSAVNRIAYRRSLLQSLLGYAITGTVSIVMLTGMFYILNYVYGFRFIPSSPHISLHIPVTPLLTWSIFIAFLMLMLLMMDYAFRHSKAKS
jgi:hypothetical protein